jgi:hypothetical protein
MATPIRFSKPDAISRWESLDEDLPCPMRPIQPGQTGSTYAEDTIRLTGSQEWIDWCLSRLKPVLEFENDNTSRIEILYTQTCERYKNDEGKLVTGDLTGSYAAYVKAKSRGRGRVGRKPKNGQPREPKPAKEVNPLREVNAGLTLKAKPKTDTTTPPKKGVTTPAYTDALYAVARAYTDEETNERIYEWLEPIGDHPVFPMQTYDDVGSFDDSMDRLAKELKMKRKDMQKIEVIVNNDGSLKFEEF